MRRTNWEWNKGYSGGTMLSMLNIEFLLTEDEKWKLGNCREF